MGLSEALSLLFSFLLMFALAMGAILRGQVLGPGDFLEQTGPVASASMADPTPGAPPLVAYARGPGEIVLEWTSDAKDVVRWQYRLLERQGESWEPLGDEVWGPWGDIPGSGPSSNRLRVGGLREATLYYVQVRPLVATGSDAAALAPGDPLDPRQARTLFVGDDGIPWLRVNDLAGGGGTYRIGGTDYVVDVSDGMLIQNYFGDVHYMDVPFSGGLNDFRASLRDLVTGSWVEIDSGEYVRRVITWPAGGDTDWAAAAAALRVNEWFDAIVASTRRVPFSGVGPSPVPTGLCGSGDAVPSPERNPGLASDCYAMLGTGNDEAGPNWDLDTPISTWDGVTVAGTPPRVVRLEVPPGRFGPRLELLDALTHLDLSGYRSSYRIPIELGALQNLQVLYVGENTGLEGCIPPPLRDVPTNDLDTTGLPDCGSTAELYWEISLEQDWPDREAPGTTLAVGESRWLHIVFRRAPWAPVTIELDTEAAEHIEIEPDVVRFGTRFRHRAVRLTGVRPGEDIEIQLRITSDGDPEYDELPEPTLVMNVSPTHLRALVGGGPGEAVLEWDTTERGVERWQYRRRSSRSSWREWTDVPGSDGSTSSYRVAGLTGRENQFEVRPWMKEGPGRPSDTSEMLVARTGSSGAPSPYSPGEVESGRRYELFGYTIDVPAGLRLSVGYLVINGQGSRRLTDLATGSWFWLGIDGEFSDRWIVSPEVPGTRGSIASLRALREVNWQFDRLVDSLR